MTTTQDNTQANATGVPNGQSTEANTQQMQSNANGGVLNSLLGLSNSTPQANFIKGAVIGAVAAYIISSPEAQKAIFKGISKITSLFEMGVEELKERYEDAKAEAKES